MAGTFKDFCKVYDNGFATLEHDSFPSPIKLKIDEKGEHRDAFKVLHGGTVGSFKDNTAEDARYVLACPQVKDQKTLQFTITRPKALTAFGSEWVKLYPKDSWTNITNEFEPYTFNAYGGKIPLPEIRATPNKYAFDDEADEKGELVVYMEVSEPGDFEVKYGNPGLKFDDKWVGHEFKGHLLRVGTPWANCGGGTSLGEETFGVGSVMPIEFGHPNLNIDKYDKVILELQNVKVPIMVVLEIFRKDVKTWTSSVNFADKYTKCYEAGNPCPEGHSVCKSSHCELDKWQDIVKRLKDASPEKLITVLGAVDAKTTPSEYDQIDVDGFYFSDPDDVETSISYDVFKVVAIAKPLFDKDMIDDADVWVTLIDSAEKIGVWSPFSWYPGYLPSKWAALVVSASVDEYDPLSRTTGSLVEALVDRGYGYVYTTSASDFTEVSEITGDMLTKLEEIAEDGLPAPVARRLSELESAPTAFWSCDDTLVECAPVCLKTTGLVTNRVSEKQCAHLPKDECACAGKCYHNAEYRCYGLEIKCFAQRGLEEATIVGDMVCSMRGTPKPDELPDCEPLKASVGSLPLGECFGDLPTSTTKEPVTTTSEPEVELVKERRPEPKIRVVTSSAALLSLLFFYIC